MSYEMKPNLGDWFTAATASFATAGGITALFSPIAQEVGNHLSAIFYQSTPLAADPSRFLGILIPHIAVAGLTFFAASKVANSVVKAKALDGGRVTTNEPGPPPPMVS